MSTYKELLQNARNNLMEHEIADADLDAWYLLAHVFQINRTDYFMNKDIVVQEKEKEKFLELVKLRASHVPLQYITGTQEFMGLEFDVCEDVLIPRQDTEILVEEVLKVSGNKSVLDMCTGSGCIIISLAKLGGLKQATAADISPKALRVASENACKHMVNIEFIQSDLFEKVTDEYDIIVSNPPYIPSGDIKSLMPEVKNHEPVLALDGSEDGLCFYRRITALSKTHLKRNGYIFFEIGWNQGSEVSKILQDEGFTDIKIKKDLSGLDRVVTGRRS